MSEERFFTDEQVDIALRTANKSREDKVKEVIDQAEQKEWVKINPQKKNEVGKSKTRRTILMTVIATVGIAAFVNKGIPFITNLIDLGEVRISMLEIEKEFKKSNDYNGAILEYSDDYKELMKQKAEIEERLGFNKTDKGMSK